MHPTKAFLSALAFVAHFASAAPIEPRESSSTSLSQPFQILIRPVDLQGPNVYQEPLYLVQSSTSSSSKTPYAIARHGNSSTFQLKDGVLSTTFTSKDVTTGKNQTTTWLNVPFQKGQLVGFETAAQLKTAKWSQKITVSSGGASALMGIDQDVYPWYFCTNKADGSQMGLSVENIASSKVQCTNVYAYVVPIS